MTATLSLRLLPRMKHSFGTSPLIWPTSFPARKNSLSSSATATPPSVEYVIDKHLASDSYARHLARDPRDVVSAKYTDRRQLAMVPEFEKWLTAQFKANKSWGDIAWAILTAEAVSRSVPFGPGPRR